MRLFIILLFLFQLSFLLTAQSLKEEGELNPVISFNEDLVDLGEAMEGEVLEYTFEFVNKGKDALVISNIVTSCGCTIVDWSRRPVYPSKKGKIAVKFDTKNNIGLQTKSIIILSNSDKEKDEIKLRANIISRSEAKINSQH